MEGGDNDNDNDDNGPNDVLLVSFSNLSRFINVYYYFSHHCCFKRDSYHHQRGTQPSRALSVRLYIFFLFLFY